MGFWKSDRITSDLPAAAEPAGLVSFPLLGEELYKLQVLRECGALTEDEFTRAKALVLDGEPAGRSAAEASRDVRRRPNWLWRLARSKRDAVLGGVCSGLGEHTPLPPWCWRILFCLTAMLWGGGAIAYVVLWMSLPSEGKQC
jgi:phage shock protein PspC (stress-responsive transcriptional regulator)